MSSETEQPMLECRKHGRVAKLRVFAWLIDWLLTLGLSAMFGSMGLFVSFAYWLSRDCLFEGQSVGKRVLRLKVISESGARCSLQRSLLRNALWVIPVVNLAFAIMGLYALLHDSKGQHWGDRLADTLVVRADVPVILDGADRS